MRSWLACLVMSCSACAGTNQLPVAQVPSIDADSLIRVFAGIHGKYVRGMGAAFIPETQADGVAYYGAVQHERWAVPALIECVGHAEASLVTNESQKTSLGSLCLFAIIETHWFQTRLQRSELPQSYPTSLWLQLGMDTEARHAAVRDVWRGYFAGDSHRTNVDSTDIPPLIPSADVTVRGIVIGEGDRKPVAGAAIAVAPAGVQFTIPVTVDSAGRFAVRLRQPGLYTFITRHDGFSDGRVNVILPIPTNGEIEIGIVPTERRTVCLDSCPITGHVQILRVPN